MSSLQIKPMSWEYIAAFFDGEGCIAVRRQRKHLTYTYWLSWCQNANRAAVLLEIREFLEKHGYKVYTNEQKGRNQCEITVAQKLDVLRCLKRMLPYLRVKREEAHLVIEYLEDLLQIQKEWGQRYWVHTGYRITAPELRRYRQKGGD